ncbi:MAG: tyrosine-type recombinase/integrase [Chloroflexi bacterium]|nr:tyrosine-type recombinase/integrase [Chloroflexota bacterium]
MSDGLTLKTGIGGIIIPQNADKHTKSRLGQFVVWMDDRDLLWHQVDLAAYRDAMEDAGKAPATVNAHLSTIRARYRAIVRDNATRDSLYRLAEQVADAPSDRKSFVDEILTRVENAIAPQASQVRVKVSQDRADSAHLRLTREQAEALMMAPGVNTLMGLRDTAVIALMLCTGIREAELSSLKVPDLRQRLGGELALHVREGKGCKERLVPYGELSWVLAVVDAWFSKAGIGGGYVFRGLYKGGKTLRTGRLSVRAIGHIMGRYPMMVDGEMVHVKPHDLRRTYARRLFEAGTDPVAIQQNLGHSGLATTLGYIGNLDVTYRRAPAVYTFDLSKLVRET